MQSAQLHCKHTPRIDMDSDGYLTAICPRCKGYDLIITDRADYRPRACKAGLIIGTRKTAKQCETLRALIEDSATPCEDIELMLITEGLQLSDSTIRRHRRKICLCVSRQARPLETLSPTAS